MFWPDFSRLALSGILLLALTACASDGGASLSGDEQFASAIPDGPLTPKSLLGVVPHALSARLGEPNFKRTEPIGAEVWQYSGGACNLFVYFYRNKEGSLGSTYVDARKSVGGDTSTGNCLDEVQRSRASVPVS